MTESSDAEREFDTSLFDLPVTRAELWDLLTDVDLMVFTARTMAIAAANGDTKWLEELRRDYEKQDTAFKLGRDKLVKSKKRLA